MRQTIRIIGGKHRGKKLSFPDLNGLRPTPDRVRETLFNWLMHDIRDARCLDAFAGSGALGFEAASRGAGSVVLIEKSPIAYAHLKRMASELNLPQIRLVLSDAINYIQQTAETFNLVFVDPPFSEPHLLQNCIDQLAHSSVLIEGGLLYLESAEELALDKMHWDRIQSKKTGALYYQLWKKQHRVSNSAKPS